MKALKAFSPFGSSSMTATDEPVKLAATLESDQESSGAAGWAKSIRPVYCRRGLSEETVVWARALETRQGIAKIRHVARAMNRRRRRSRAEEESTEQGFEDRGITGRCMVAPLSESSALPRSIGFR